MNRRALFRFLPAALATRLSARQPREIASPIRTGLKDVDEVMGGLPPGSLTVLYSHHQGGKTTLAINIAEHVALNERRPVFYLVPGARGPNAQTLLGQIICSRARVDYLDFAEGKLEQEERARVRAAKLDLERCPVTIDDTPHLEDAEIVQRIEAWSTAHPGGLVIIDDFEQRNTALEVDRCSHALKSVAVRTNTAILGTAIHALLADYQCDVYGVGLRHADFAWHLFRPWCCANDLYSRDVADLSVVDQRTGEHRLILELRLDEKLRRFHVVGSRQGAPSLREARLQRSDRWIYHRYLKPGEEPPPGSRLIHIRGVHLEPSVELWESAPDWEA